MDRFNLQPAYHSLRFTFSKVRRRSRLYREYFLRLSDCFSHSFSKLKRKMKSKNFDNLGKYPLSWDLEKNVNLR